MTSEAPDGEERPAGAHPAVRAARTLAVILMAAVALTGSLAAAGPLGLVVAADCLAAVGLILTLTGVPRRTGSGRGGAAARPRLAIMPDEAWRNWPPVRWLTSRAAPGRRGRHEVRATEFPTYLKISSDLSWAPVSRWHYDHGTRPLLARLLEAALAEGQRVDATADQARARRLAGDEVWRLVAPGQHHDSNAPGVDLRTLGQITDRLEQLWPDPLERP